MNCFNDPLDVAGGDTETFKIKLIYLLAVLMTHQKQSTAKIKCL